LNEFVDECRREWKRLGVPPAIAEEMATDVAADLEEAEAEGVDAEQVLGRHALDPRGLALAWAAERGVIPGPGNQNRRTRRLLLLAAIAALALVAVLGAVLVIHESPTTSDNILVSPDGRLALRSPLPVRIRALPGGNHVWITKAASAEMDGSDSGTRTGGLVLLIAGLAGVVVLTTFASWTPRRPSALRARS
jgi:hypothetical protein